jgi:soluble lytic murein transglycosylase-like protein
MKTAFFIDQRPLQSQSQVRDDPEGKKSSFPKGIDIRKYDKIIAKAASKFNLDVALIKAVIKAESNFNHQAVSRAGAKGLMQLMRRPPRL